MARGSVSLLAEPMPPVPEELAAAVAARMYGVAGQVASLGGERDRNFLVGEPGRLLSVKFAHPAESIPVLEMQQRALIHLAEADPGLPVAQAVPTVDGDLVAVVPVGGVPLPVRAVTFLPAPILEGRPVSAALRHDVAAVLARLDRALGGFSHPAADRDYLWDLAQILRLRPHAERLEPERRNLVAEHLDHLEAAVLPGLSGLRAQMIHADVNPANLLVDPSAPDRVAGLIDFGDLMPAPLVFDPAIAAAYLSLKEDDPVAIAAGFAADYHAHLPLTGAEVEVFGDLIRARLCQSLIVSAWRAGLHPHNRSYILMHAEPVWAALRALSGQRDELAAAVHDCCEGTGA